MTFPAIEELNRHVAPGVFCQNIRDKNDLKEYLVPLSHVLAPSLENESLRAMREFLADLPNANQFLRFYEKHNGAQLFISRKSKEPAIPILPYELWDEFADTVRKWYNDIELSDREESDLGLCYSLQGLKAIALLNYSPDTWLMATDGPLKGRIFFWGHDGEPLTNTPFAEDFDSFVAKLMATATDCFGGIIRFAPSEALSAQLPENAELYPVRYTENCGV